MTSDRTSDLDMRSFGRRRGRKLSPRQETLLADLLPRLALDLSRPPAPDQLGPAATPLWLEIGFGGAEHMIWQAERNPAVRIIGCEPFEEGIVKALSAIASLPLDNLRLHADDARAVLRWLPPASLDRCFVLYPDPWPKKRHAKRRLLSAPTLALIARALKPGAELRIATDIGDYARTILIAAAATPQLEWQARTASDWRVRPGDWPQTRYEAKAVREGRTSAYLRFHRVLAPH